MEKHTFDPIDVHVGCHSYLHRLPLPEAMAEVEKAHFRTEHDTGAHPNARLVWNSLRRKLGLPDVKFPKWNGTAYVDENEQPV